MNSQRPIELTAKQERYTKQAAGALTEFYRSRNAPFHFRHLQVLFETQYFHIATAKAIYRLIDQGLLSAVPFQAGANQVSFLIPSRALQSPKGDSIVESHMKNKAKVIALYDNPEMSKDLGDHFESLVKLELRANQLRIVATHTNSYKGKQWIKSKANLDIIAEHPDGRAFGIQAKNELKGIEKEELLEQLDICNLLRVKPLFIVRYMPWDFVPAVVERGGFVITLGTQLWPIGHRKVCEQIQEKMSIPDSHVSTKLKQIAPKMRTRWPIAVMTEVPEAAASRLAYWLNTGKIPLGQEKLKLIEQNVNKLEEILHAGGKEEEAHQFLKNNSLILGFTSTIEPISKFKLGDDYVTDFVIQEIPDGYVLVEIERPGITLFKKATPPERTQELNHAIEQIENWRAWVGRNHAYVSGKLEGISSGPMCWLICGRRTDLSKPERTRLAEINDEHKGSYKIFTYDDLIDRLRLVLSRLREPPPEESSQESSPQPL